VRGAAVRCLEVSVDPEIEELREQIAERDREIVSAVNARLQLVRRLKAHKDEHGLPLLDIRQEQRIHRRLARFNPGPLSEKGVHELVGEILDLMKRELRGVDPEE
jgi:chorismate mutase